ncbi:MAG: WYL domain-containing protein [Clostridia bacterium]|nr:WYL domain-containing protein [Clostridia bacterium]
MKFKILLDILFDLLEKGKLTAPYLAEKYRLSTRTVYRYIEILASAVPVTVQRGRNGGIFIADTFKLPVGFLKEDEHEAVIEALRRAYAEAPNERFLSAKKKLSAERKTEKASPFILGETDSIIVYDGAHAERSLLRKIRLIEDCIRTRTVMDISYYSLRHEETQRNVEPHLLVCRQNVWYVYAFCHTRRDFHLFHIGRIFSASKTDRRFQKRPFKTEEIPFHAATSETALHLRCDVTKNALDEAQDLFGIENVRPIAEDKWRIDVVLPDSEQLFKQLVCLGADVKVLTPKSLQEKIRSLAQTLLNVYP